MGSMHVTIGDLAAGETATEQLVPYLPKESSSSDRPIRVVVRDPHVRGLIAKILGRAGYPVEAFGALPPRGLSESGLLIMDELPLREVLREDPSLELAIPLVVVRSYAIHDGESEMFAPVSWLSKPFHPENLLELVAKALIE